jgi:tRNA dimethylallyltransferase
MTIIQYQASGIPTTPEKPSIVVIAGPTCVGKTSTAIALAKPIGAQIVSADAMQVYRHMNIGTAKPSQEELAEVTHHMIDVVDPDEPFTAARFRTMATAVIKRLHRDRTPIFVVGGTGLYIRALTKGLFRADEDTQAVRARLREEVQTLGTTTLYERLSAVDPAAAATIHPNDTYRIVRALEVCEATGKPISQHHQAHGFSDVPYRVLKIGLFLDRQVLYDRINTRVDRMLASDFLDEVKGLLAQGYGPGLKAMQSIGYRHTVAYLEGTIPWEEMVELFKRDTRRYAKRQLTWFRADDEIIWHEPGQTDLIKAKIDAFLTG